MDTEKLKILLIEDNPGDARLMRELLAETPDAPFRMEQVDTIAKGLARLAEGGVGVILLDLSLPDSQGLEGLDRIVAQTQVVPIVVLSGLSDEIVAIKAVQTGAQDYLVKRTTDRNLLMRTIQHSIERQRLRVALGESEARYRLLADNIADVIWTADSEARITFVSPSIERLLGYTVEDALKLKISDILTPDSADQARRFVKWQIGLYARGSQSPSASMTLEHVRKDGSTVWAEVMLSFLRGADGRIMGIMGATRDITERKKAEEALRKSEDYFKALTENTSDGIVVLNGDGTVLYESSSFERILGYKPEDRLGRNSFEFIHPDDIPSAAKLFEQLVQNPDLTIQAEVRAKHQDGSLHVLEVTGKNLVNNAAVGGIIANFRDITERKKMEQDLLRLSDAVRMSKDGFVITDQEGRILEANRATVKMHGLENRADIIGRLAMELVGPEDMEMVTDVMTQALSTGHVPYVEFSGLRNDGSKFLIEASISVIKDKNGQPTGYMGITRDITERRRMEEALRESEERFRAVFEGASLGIALVGFDRNVIGINPAFERVLGYSLEEFGGLTNLEYLHPDDAMLDAKLYMDIVKGKCDHYTVDKRYIRKDGQVLWGRQNLSVIRGAEGKPRYFIAMLEDITERKRAEEEKRRLEEQIQLAGRLAAVGELAAGVAHELNNPIAAIKGFAQLLAAREDVDVGVKKDLQTIFRESQRASKITQNMLIFARRHEPEKCFISVNEALEKTLELRAHQLKGNNIELEAELDPNLPKTMADFYQMQQVFLNIINNAEQAMVEAHGKGKLIVRTRKVGGMVHIDFTDDGPGISEEDLRRIFDPFFTTKEVGKGTGLGLSICYGLVEAHCGRIYAKSKQGHGAIFVVEIPIVTEEQAKAESALPDPGSRGVI